MLRNGPASSVLAAVVKLSAFRLTPTDDRGGESQKTSGHGLQYIRPCTRKTSVDVTFGSGKAASNGARMEFLGDPNRNGKDPNGSTSSWNALKSASRAHPALGKRYGFGLREQPDSLEFRFQSGRAGLSHPHPGFRPEGLDQERATGPLGVDAADQLVAL